MKHEGIDLMNGTFYWLMNGEGITIGRFDEWHSGMFVIVGSDEYFSPDCFQIIQEVVMEHFDKFPPGSNVE